MLLVQDCWNSSYQLRNRNAVRVDFRYFPEREYAECGEPYLINGQ